LRAPVVKDKQFAAKGDSKKEWKGLQIGKSKRKQGGEQGGGPKRSEDKSF